jgi:hypothetical protein
VSGFRKVYAYPWALTGIFAAVHLVITLIPFTIAIGGGGSISFGLVSAPILGFLLGPFYGVIAVVIGSLLAMFINPTIAILGPFTVFATAAGAFAAGSMRRNMQFAVPIIFIVAFGVYLSSPVGVAVPLFIWFHVIVFILSFLFIIPKTSSWLVKPLNLKINTSRWKRFGSIWLFSLVAVSLDNMVGSAIGGWYFILGGAPADIIIGLFAAGLVIIPIERIIGSILVTLVIVALVEALSGADYGLPLPRIENNDVLELQEEEI